MTMRSVIGRVMAVGLVVFFGACEPQAPAMTETTRTPLGDWIVGEVKATLDGAAVELSWSPVADIGEYEIARRASQAAPAALRKMMGRFGLRAATTGDWESVAKTGTSPFKERLSRYGTYEYRVRGLGGDGTQTQWSSPAAVEYKSADDTFDAEAWAATDLSGSWMLAELDDAGTYRSGSLLIDCYGNRCSVDWVLEVDIGNDGGSEGDYACTRYGEFMRAQGVLHPAWQYWYCSEYTESGWENLELDADNIAYLRINDSQLEFNGLVYELDRGDFYPFGGDAWLHFPGGVFSFDAELKVLQMSGHISESGPFSVDYIHLHDVTGDTALDIERYFGTALLNGGAGTLQVTWTRRTIEDGATAAETAATVPAPVTWNYTYDAANGILVVAGEEYRTFSYWLDNCCNPLPFQEIDWMDFPGGEYDLDGTYSSLYLASAFGVTTSEIYRTVAHDLVGDATVDREQFSGTAAIDVSAGTLQVTWSDHRVIDGGLLTSTVLSIPSPQLWSYAYYATGQTFVVDGTLYHTENYWLNMGGGQVGSGEYTVSSPAYVWNTAADGAAGTQLMGPGVDDDMALVELPFPVTFYGIGYDELSVSSNGFVQFGINTSSYCCSRQLPNDYLPAAVAVNWRDLVTQSNGSVRTATTGVSPNRLLVVTYYNMAPYGEPDAGDRYQVILSEAQPDQIRVQYQTVTLSGLRGTNAGDGVVWETWTAGAATAVLLIPQ